MLADKILSFLFHLQLTSQLPEGYEALNPFSDFETRRVCNEFFMKYYNDRQPRYCIIGINPGRFGAGVTGVPFTDPIRLEKMLGIENGWPKKQELSSVFIYQMIEAFGGVEKFYHNFYVTAVSPLGLVKDGKNVNYYDNRELQLTVTPFAVDCLQTQLQWGLQRDVAFCLGEGKNFQFLEKINREYQFFNRIIPLPHPRFIMQYKLKQKAGFIEKYLAAFEVAFGSKH